MARVQYKATAGGIQQRRNGDAWEGVTVEHTGGTVYAAETGTTPYPGPLTTNVDGEVPGWLDPGRYTTKNPLSGRSVTFEVGGASSFTPSAVGVTFTPAGTIAATNVQAAIEEVAAEAGTGGSSADASTAVKGVSKLSVAPVDLANPIAVGTNDARMSDARPPTAHGHPQSDVTGLTTDLAGKIPYTLLDAKGDILVSSGPDAVARLALSGVAGRILTEDPTAPLGVAWLAPGATGGGGTEPLIAESWTGADGTVWVSSGAFWNSPADDGAYENARWFAESGSISLLGNTGRSTSSLMRAWTRRKDLTYPRVEVDVRFDGWVSGTASWHGINLWLNYRLKTPEDGSRINDADATDSRSPSGYAIDFNNRDGTIYISKKTGAGVYFFPVSTTFTPTVGQWYRIVAEVIDNGTTTTIRLLRAPLGQTPVEILSWTDDGTTGGARLTGGRVGLRSDYADVRFDNLSITTPNANQAVPYRDKVMAKTPLTYFRLGEDPAGSPKDEILLITNGTSAGATSVPGLLTNDTNRAYDIAGVSTDRAVAGGDVLRFEGTASFSAVIWYRPDVVDTTFRYLFSKQDGVNGWGLWYRSAGLAFGRISAGAFHNVSAAAPVVGTRYLVVLTYDGATSRLYVDNAAPVAYANTASIGANTSAFRIGLGVDGVVDEPAVFGHVLSSADVTELWNAGA